MNASHKDRRVSVCSLLFSVLFLGLHSFLAQSFVLKQGRGFPEATLIRTQSLDMMSLQPQQYPQEEDPLKWEKMYATGDVSDDAEAEESIDISYGVPVKVISFDLDDTLWDTKGIIGHANNALDAFLTLHYPEMGNVSIPTEMRRIWNGYLAEDSSLGNEPANLSWLRKEALKQAAIQCNYSNPEDIAEEAFDYWHHERLAVEPFMFDGVVDVLSALKDQGILLGAITNGNADTSKIPVLSKLFSFHIMAEEVGKRKPDPAIFQESIRRVAALGVGEELRASWVHIGDDFKGDCIGAKGLDMRTILFNPPSKSSLKAKEISLPLDNSPSDKLPNIPMGGSVEMDAVGTEDYMAEMIRNDFVDAEINNFNELLDIVNKWNKEAEVLKQKREKAYTSLTPNDSGNENDLALERTNDSVSNTVTKKDLELIDSLMKTDNIDGLVSIVTSKSAVENEKSSSAPDTTTLKGEVEQKNPEIKIDSEAPASGIKTTKFCFECGEKISRTAKFCPECGTKQVA